MSWRCSESRSEQGVGFESAPRCGRARPAVPLPRRSCATSGFAGRRRRPAPLPRASSPRAASTPRTPAPSSSPRRAGRTRGPGRDSRCNWKAVAAGAKRAVVRIQRQSRVALAHRLLEQSRVAQDVGQREVGARALGPAADQVSRPRVGARVVALSGLQEDETRPRPPRGSGRARGRVPARSWRAAGTRRPSSGPGRTGTPTDIAGRGPSRPERSPGRARRPARASRWPARSARGRSSGACCGGRGRTPRRSSGASPARSCRRQRPGPAAGPGARAAASDRKARRGSRRASSSCRARRRGRPRCRRPPSIRGAGRPPSGTGP